MFFFSVLVINNELSKPEMFSEILTNLSKQKLEIIKLNKLNKHF